MVAAGEVVGRLEEEEDPVTCFTLGEERDAATCHRSGLVRLWLVGGEVKEKEVKEGEVKEKKGVEDRKVKVEVTKTFKSIHSGPVAGKSLYNPFIHF